MKIFPDGACSVESTFNLIDPSAFSEPEFEAHAVKALVCAYADYHCIPFRADFSFENETRRADLAFIHRSFSHWFIIEVELIAHSLFGHVVPQVRCFRYGEPLANTAELLCVAIPGMDYSRALSFLQFVPRSVLVVANRRSEEWQACLRGLDVQMVVVSVYQRGDGQILRELDGSLTAAKENLGFFRYSASDRAIRIPMSVLNVEGSVRIEDPFGAVGMWIATRTDNFVWLTKEFGDPGISHNEMLQVIRTVNGSLKLKRILL